MRQQLGATPSRSADQIIKSFLARPNVLETVTVSSASTLTLTTTSSTYVFSGTTTTWTLPAVSGNTGFPLILENRGSGSITLNRAGTDNIWFLSALTSMTIGAGGSLMLINDGTYWNALSVDLAHNAAGILPVANGGSGATTLTGLVVGNGTSAFTTVTAPAGAVLGTTDAQTLTNKWVKPRVGSTTSSATPSINTDNYDQYELTALAVNITSMTTNLTGTPVDGQKLMLRFLDNGTPRTITWGSSFVSSGVATLLATTVASKTHLVGLVYDSNKAAWVCVAVDATGY